MTAANAVRPYLHHAGKDGVGVRRCMQPRATGDRSRRQDIASQSRIEHSIEWKEQSFSLQASVPLDWQTVTTHRVELLETVGQFCIVAGDSERSSATYHIRGVGFHGVEFGERLAIECRRALAAEGCNSVVMESGGAGKQESSVPAGRARGDPDRVDRYDPQSQVKECVDCRKARSAEPDHAAVHVEIMCKGLERCSLSTRPRRPNLMLQDCPLWVPRYRERKMSDSELRQ